MGKRIYCYLWSSIWRWIKNGIREGYGIKYLGKQKLFESDYKNNKANGYGIYYYLNGDRFEGEAKNSKLFHRFRIFYSSLGFKIKRYFKNEA